MHNSKSGKEYLAHLIIEKNRREQTLKEHCFRVSEYAAEALKACGLSTCGKIAGLLHDMGKGNKAFQKYLKESATWDAYRKGFIDEPEFPEPKKGNVIHTFQGCKYILERYHRIGKDSFYPNLTSEILAYAVGAHHGLFDCESLDGKNGFLHRIGYNEAKLQYEESKKFLEEDVIQPAELDSLFHEASDEVTKFVLKLIGEIGELKLEEKRKLNYVHFEISMAARMITSALMYADRRDTAEFCDERLYSDIKPNWAEDIREFEQKYCRFEEKRPIDAVRKDIANQCVRFSREPSGIYRLNVPTGGGKTLSALRYALYHADKYKKKKILFVIPLLSVIDQNAAVLKEYLPKEIVLEHHSDVVTEDMNETELSQYDLMRDRWLAPVIITTMVRILDILFSAKTGDVARMRALCDAVIIFDEVQSVPNKVTSLYTGAMNFLADFCKADIILCSATQPAFEKTAYPLHAGVEKPVVLSANQMKAFERHQYHLLAEGNQMSLDEIAEAAGKIAAPGKPLMVVCNTKNEAKQIYMTLTESGSYKAMDVRHLSAGMCKAHRKKVVDEITAALKKIQQGENHSTFILVTTQLVEAGVDLSFQSVIRLEAGDDNLVQSAGRCNRSNEYGSGEVYMARVKDEDSSLRNLPDIQTAKTSMDDTIGLYGQETGFHPEDETFIENFYRVLYARLGTDGQTLFPFEYSGETYCIGNILSNELSPSGTNKDFILNQPFSTAGKAFQVFDENTYTVLVPYEEGADLIKKIRASYRFQGNIPISLSRKAGEYSVQIYEWQKRKMEENGTLYDICQEAGSLNASSEKIYAVYPIAYDEIYGLNQEAQYQSSNMIF